MISPTWNEGICRLFHPTYSEFLQSLKLVQWDATVSFTSYSMECRSCCLPLAIGARERLFLPRAARAVAAPNSYSVDQIPSDGRADLDLITQIHTAYSEENKQSRFHSGCPCIGIERQWGSSRLKSRPTPSDISTTLAQRNH
jgi:hypothetical protein